MTLIRSGVRVTGNRTERPARAEPRGGEEKGERVEYESDELG